MSRQRLQGKVALITGASSGIGEASARLFAEHGAFVIIADIQDDLGQEVAASIGPKASYVHCDVTNESDVESAVKHAVDRHGTLDVLLSNAGILGSFSTVLDLDLRGFDRTMGINLMGAAATIKHASRVMVDRNVKGSIVCTASVAAAIGGAAPAAYTASKHALVGLVKAACAELGAYGIRVNSVSPFGVATPLSCRHNNAEPGVIEAMVSEQGNLKGVVLKAKDIAEAALFLASDDSAYVSGVDLAVDGGFRVVAHSFNQYPAAN